jgi:mannose-6-phosphate isomerase
MFMNSVAVKTIPPFKLSPVFKDYIWGGNRLKLLFNKQTELPSVAESWELSAHPDGQSIIASGSYAGALFGDTVARYPELCAGEFPILIKLIDARQTLSVQVHPGDEYARRWEGQPGKTEVWIILDCDEEAFVYHGFNRAVSKEEVRLRIAENTLTDILHKRLVKPGDTVFIPAGTVHAIGRGIVLAEIQQSSNVTYRVYDFDRIGTDGKPRPLHIGKALEVMELSPSNPIPPGARQLCVSREYTLEQLISCPVFSVQRLDLNGRFTYPANPKSFTSMLCTNGSAVMESAGESLPITKGDCVFIPASQQNLSLKGAGQLLITKCTREHR